MVFVVITCFLFGGVVAFAITNKIVAALRSKMGEGDASGCLSAIMWLILRYTLVPGIMFIIGGSLVIVIEFIVNLLK